MRNLKDTVNAGDTLIEVIFAFAILSTIIGFAFTGAIQARKTAIAAQQRTQAVFIAQQQTESLKAYRDSLPWGDDPLEIPNFINGGNGSAVIDSSEKYCMRKVDNSPSPPPIIRQWLLVTNNDSNNPCPNTSLQALPSREVIQIQFACISPTSSTQFAECEILRATVEVKWLDPYGRESSVINLVNLTKNL